MSRWVLLIPLHQNACIYQRIIILKIQKENEYKSIYKQDLLFETNGHKYNKINLLECNKYQILGACKEFLNLINNTKIKKIKHKLILKNFVLP